MSSARYTWSLPVGVNDDARGQAASGSGAQGRATSGVARHARAEHAIVPGQHDRASFVPCLGRCGGTAWYNSSIVTRHVLMLCLNRVMHNRISVVLGCVFHLAIYSRNNY